MGDCVLAIYNVRERILTFLSPAYANFKSLLKKKERLEIFFLTEG